jgi:hypothetical protein
VARVDTFYGSSATRLLVILVRERDTRQDGGSKALADK